MPKNSDPSKTNANKVRQQNQLSQQGRSAMNEEFASETDANEVRRQNQQSQQGRSAMNEEFASETDVNEVKQQNQQSQNKMRNSSGQSMNRYENGSR